MAAIDTNGTQILERIAKAPVGQNVGWTFVGCETRRGRPGHRQSQWCITARSPEGPDHDITVKTEWGDSDLMRNDALRMLREAMPKPLHAEEGQ